MTRDQVRQIIGEGVTEEQINAILNANSADIGRARQNDADNQQTITQLIEQLHTAQETITRLEGSNADAEQVRNELERYRTAEQQRTAAAEAEATEARIRSRFDFVVGQQKFVNDYTRDGVYAQFRAAVSDGQNTGRGDADVFAELIRDKTGVMANPNPVIDIYGPANLNDQALTVEAFKQMPLHEQMAWANTNPEMYARMSDILAKKG